MNQPYIIKDHTNTFLIRGKEYKVTAPAKFDRRTGELIPDQRLDDAAVALANAKYRQEMDIVSPEEIKKYRARMNLSQRELADLMGWSPTTIALYETGAFPSESNNRILKALINDDDFLASFISPNQQSLSKKIVKKMTSYLSDRKAGDTSLKHNTEFTALQLTNWFRVRNYFSLKTDPNAEELTQMKVVKLLYFAFGRWIAKTGGELFTSKIIAMPYGPVVEDVHKKYNGRRGIVPQTLEKSAFEDFNLVQSDRKIADLLRKVDNDFRGYTAAGLVHLTHRKGSPWDVTRSGVIAPQLIKKTFDQHQEM